MSNRYVEKYSTYYLISVRMTIIQKTTKVGKDVEKTESFHTVGGNANQYNIYEKQY